MVTVLRRGFWNRFFQNNANIVNNEFFGALGSNNAAFFMFLRPKTYPKVWAEPVIRIPDTAFLVSRIFSEPLENKDFFYRKIKF